MGYLFLCRYLQKDKINGPEGNTLYYELAERALDGPINGRIKEYISQVVTGKVNYASSVIILSSIYLIQYWPINA